MRVLVVGSGAREHAILWKLSQSRSSLKLYCAPGNGGTASIAENVSISAEDIESLASWALSHSIDLTVVGPEAPLAAGIADRFRQLGLPVFGPGKDAARIESSKAWAKEVMRRYNVPTARSATFTSLAAARVYIREQIPPIVIKADGLAAGKGVTIAPTIGEAERAARQLLEEGALGEAGSKIVVEEHLTGLEVSLLALTDGKTVVPMAPACDYKRVFDGDQGPNTGGMGAYSPPGFFTENLLQTIMDEILKPTIDGMAAEGIPYIGVIYAGLMITETGPKVLEFNCRFGDPETQVILPRLQSDLLEVMLHTLEGKLHKVAIQWDDGAACGVVLASEGYPGTFSKGHIISGLDRVDADALVFHAGTSITPHGLATSGGRVLTVVGRGRTLREAREKAYDNAARVRFAGCHYRKDIALREV